MFGLLKKKLTNIAEGYVRGFVGFLLVIASLLVVGAVAAVSLNTKYWMLSPKEKFLQSWQDDVKLLRTSKKLPPGWDHVSQLEIKSDNSPAVEWVDALKPRLHIDQTGTYKLNVMVIHWIEGNKYGAIIQYSMVDLKSGNTIWEISRTLHLGYLI